MRAETKVASSSALFAAAAAAATSSSAMAADILNTKARPVLAPAPIAAWQGFYVGGSLGGSWLDSTQDDTGAASKLFGGYYSSSGTSSQNASALGFLGGLQAGYNFQSARAVYGVEADFSWIGGGSASSTSSQPLNRGYYSYGTETGTKSSKVKALATFRARFGIDMDGTMPYLTAGFALGQIRNSYGATFNFPGPGPGPLAGSSITQSTSKTSWEPGLVLGGGIEHRFANSPWSIKGEALWVGFKDTQLNVAYGGYSTPVKFKNELVIGKIGLNYRF